MTRETFQTKRIESVNNALVFAQDLLTKTRGKNKIAITERYIALLERKQKEYADNFWNDDNTYYYNNLYSKMDENGIVSPY